jgi:hypothetical protein
MSPKPKTAKKKSSKGKAPLPPSQPLEVDNQLTGDHEQAETEDLSLLRRTSSAASAAESAVATGPTLQIPLHLPLTLSDYIIAPGGPLLAHWDNAVNPSNLGTFFEPQGELGNYLLRQVPHHLVDFEIPVQVGETSPYHTTEPPSIVVDPSEPDISVAQVPALEEEDMSTSTRSLKRKATTESAFVTPSAEPGPSQSRRQLSGRSDDVIAAAGPSSAKRRMSKQSVAETRVSVESTESPQAESSSRPDPSHLAGPGPSSFRSGELTARLSPVLPVGKVFPIRIGAQLFHLSGGSISSDGLSLSQVF